MFNCRELSLQIQLQFTNQLLVCSCSRGFLAENDQLLKEVLKGHIFISQRLNLARFLQYFVSLEFQYIKLHVLQPAQSAQLWGRSSGTWAEEEVIQSLGLGCLGINVRCLQSQALCDLQQFYFFPSLSRLSSYGGSVLSHLKFILLSESILNSNQIYVLL